MIMSMSVEGYCIYFDGFVGGYEHTLKMDISFVAFVVVSSSSSAFATYLMSLDLQNLHCLLLSNLPRKAHKSITDHQFYGSDWAVSVFRHTHASDVRGLFAASYPL